MLGEGPREARKLRETCAALIATGAEITARERELDQVQNEFEVITMTVAEAELTVAEVQRADQAMALRGYLAVGFGGPKALVAIAWNGVTWSATGLVRTD